MQTLQALDPETTSGKSKELFNLIAAKLGMVPNMMRTMGNSPAALGGYLNLSGALAGGKISAKLGELIAIAVANANSCGYCNSAHSFIGEKLAQIPQSEIIAARSGKSSDPKTQAALSLSLSVLGNKGRVPASEISLAKAAGFDDGAIAEIICHVGLNVLTNYFNNAAAVEIDFPQTELAATAAV